MVKLFMLPFEIIGVTVRPIPFLPTKRVRQVVADNELGGLVGALNGEYIPPGPGGDPIRNPDVLPTGKNMHALDPQSIPTKAAVDCASVVVDRLLERLSAEQGGKYPETVAFTLWGTDNIKTYGERGGYAAV